MTLVDGMLLGADSIDDMNALRRGRCRAWPRTRTRAWQVVRGRGLSGLVIDTLSGLCPPLPR